MECYGIHFNESQITHGVADPNDVFHKVSECFHELRRFQEISESKQKELDVRYRELAVERVSCKIA
jgi:hypothetical protein